MYHLNLQPNPFPLTGKQVLLSPCMQSGLHNGCLQAYSSIMCGRQNLFTPIGRKGHWKCGVRNSSDRACKLLVLNPSFWLADHDACYRLPVYQHKVKSSSCYYYTAINIKFKFPTIWKQLISCLFAFILQGIWKEIKRSQNAEAPIFWTLKYDVLIPFKWQVLCSISDSICSKEIFPEFMNINTTNFQDSLH